MTEVRGKYHFLRAIGILSGFLLLFGSIIFLSIKGFLKTDYPELDLIGGGYNLPEVDEDLIVDDDIPLEDDPWEYPIPKPPVGSWFKITPEMAKSSDGSEWHGLLKLGSEKKVIVYFLGGGAAIDDYSAARPYGVDNGFYVSTAKQDYLTKLGIASTSDANPFKDWTILVIPYSTGDFHVGKSVQKYVDLEGEERTIHHNGYDNYRAFMDEATKYLDDTEALLITGYSAGGFASSLLADDVITNYFDDVENVTAHVDAALLYSKKWQDIIEDRWGAPTSITENLNGSNLILGSLKRLSERRENVKILFDCSVRDGTLTSYQSYFTNGYLGGSSKGADMFQSNLKSTVDAMRSDIPNVGIYIWSNILHNVNGNLTQHSVIPSPQFYLERFEDDVTVAEWMIEAIDGNIQNHGLNLLN